MSPHYFNMCFVIIRCIGLSGRVVSASDCGVRGSRFESRRWQLCLSRQLLWYTVLSCAPLLQCLGRLSLPPFVGQQNEYQPMGWVIITMAMVDVDDSCQFSADSQPKSIGLVWGLAATRRSVYILCWKVLNQWQNCIWNSHQSAVDCGSWVCPRWAGPVRTVGTVQLTVTVLSLCVKSVADTDITTAIYHSKSLHPPSSS